MSQRRRDGKCIFCGSVAKLNKAHVVGRAFLSKLPTVEGGAQQTDVYRDRNDGTLQIARREENRDPRENYAKVTCHPCNGKWMQRMEDLARPLVIDMAAGIDVPLTTTQQTDIAAWATAAAMVRGTMTKGVDFVTEDARKMRKTSTLPEGFRVWMVMGERRDDIPARHTSALSAGGAGWVAWVWIGVTIYVIASPGAAQAFAARLMSLDPITQQIFPHRFSDIVWPRHPGEWGMGIDYESWLDLTNLS